MAYRSLSLSFKPSLSLLVAAAFLALGVSAQAHTTTNQQRAVANKVARDGVPLSALAANAPDSYTVKKGDTLWAISRIFLKSPWRWPELWGMNKAEVQNPHLIFPGQVLHLEKINGRARLRFGASADNSAPSGVIRVSPQVRVSSLKDSAVQPIPNHLIEPFLNQAIIVNEQEFMQAPRFVATQEGRTVLSAGDRGYVRAWRDGDLSMKPGAPRSYRVYREATPLRDPETKEILAYEAYYLGKADLVRSAGTRSGSGPVIEAVPETQGTQALFNEAQNSQTTSGSNKASHGVVVDAKVNPRTGYSYNDLNGADSNGQQVGQSSGAVDSKTWENSWQSSYKGVFEKSKAQDQGANIIPATVDIVSAKEEIRVGDRLGADTSDSGFSLYVPHAAPANTRARVMSIYSGVENAGQNQIVAINKGLVDGMERGHVLRVLTNGELVRDRTDSSRPLLKLPNEIKGDLMLFSVFDRVSYGLILEITEPVTVGDFAIDPNSLENEMQGD